MTPPGSGTPPPQGHMARVQINNPALTHVRSHLPRAQAVPVNPAGIYTNQPAPAAPSAPSRLRGFLTRAGQLLGLGAQPSVVEEIKAADALDGLFHAPRTGVLDAANVAVTSGAQALGHAPDASIWSPSGPIPLPNDLPDALLAPTVEPHFAYKNASHVIVTFPEGMTGRVSFDVGRKSEPSDGVHRMKGDSTVSGRHARITVDLDHGRMTMHDLGSTNGTRYKDARGALQMIEGNASQQIDFDTKATIVAGRYIVEFERAVPAAAVTSPSKGVHPPRSVDGIATEIRNDHVGTGYALTTQKSGAGDIYFKFTRQGSQGSFRVGTDTTLAPVREVAQIAADALTAVVFGQDRPFDMTILLNAPDEVRDAAHRMGGQSVFAMQYFVHMGNSRGPSGGRGTTIHQTRHGNRATIGQLDFREGRTPHVTIAIPWSAGITPSDKDAFSAELSRVRNQLREALQTVREALAAHMDT